MTSVESLYEAVYDGDCQRIDTLLSGRDANIRTEGDKWNLLHIALDRLIKPANPDAVRLLIKLGVDVNAKDRCGWTPLHFAARTKCPAAEQSQLIECIKLLIDAGADVNAKDEEGVTPFHRTFATNPWNLEMIEVLLAAGAKPTDMFRSFMNVVANPDKDAVLNLLAKYQAE